MEPHVLKNVDDAIQLCLKEKLTMEEAAKVCNTVQQFVQAGFEPGAAWPDVDTFMMCAMVYDRKHAYGLFTDTNIFEKAVLFKQSVCVCGTNNDPKCELRSTYSLFQGIAECGRSPPPECTWVTTLFHFENVDGNQYAVIALSWHDHVSGLLRPAARNHKHLCRILYCHNIGPYLCSTCKNKIVRYCCREHQMDDWPIHKLTCNK